MRLGLAQRLGFMRRLGFIQKLVLIIALTSGFVWLVFGGAFYRVAKNSLEDQIAEYQVAKVRDLMDTIDRTLFSAYQGIQVVAHDHPLIGFLSGVSDSEEADLMRISEDLESISLITGPWRILSVLDTEGNALVANMPESTGRSIQDHPEYGAAFQAGMNGRIYTSDLRLVGAQAEPSLIFAAPIRRGGLEESRVIGVVLGKYAWPAVMQLLDSIGQEVEAQLLRADGTVIATSAGYSHRIGSKAVEWATLEEAGFSSGSIVLDNYNESEERPSMMVAVRQRGYLGYAGEDWVLVLETPFESMLAPVYRLTSQLALIALAGVLALSAVLFFGVHYLTRPLATMSRKVSAFAQGDLSARVDVDSRTNDEISRLGQTFNTMAEDIGFYIEQVKENSEEVRAFAYIVSHDLRGPLVNLKGFSTELGYSLDELNELLAPALESQPREVQDQAAVILQEDIPEALQFIGSSVERMDGQIQAVLKLSRLGRKELVWERIDCATVVDEVLASLQHQLETKQISVEIGWLPVVTADAFALEQIFGNLLDNAVKYTTQTPSSINVWSVEHKHHWMFHVRDNGPGIDPVNISKAFELFRRVGSTDTPGEGMGLAYVKTLVRRHGGRIWCESTLGQGSTFSFTLAKDPASLAVRNVI